MTKRLIIARHGNTFDPGATPRRIGARTDLPLSESGQEQARNLGIMLHDYRIYPDRIYVSELRRTRETARIAFPDAKPEIRIFLNEIDHGPDENKTDDAISARIGEQALQDWNAKNIPPPDWNVNPGFLKTSWQDLADDIAQDETVLAVTSGGIARFVPYITDDIEAFLKTHRFKLRTGAAALFEKMPDSQWKCVFWDKRYD